MLTIFLAELEIIFVVLEIKNTYTKVQKVG